MKKLLSLLLFLSLTSVLMFARPDTVSAIPADTVASKSPEQFRPQSLILPAALFSAGATGLWVGGVKDLNRHVNHAFADWRDGRKPIRAENIIQFVPLVAYEGMGLVGVPCRIGFRDRLMAGITSEVTVEFLTLCLKVFVKEQRPMGGIHSFPSGHTARAFAGAELIRLDYGLAPAITAYVCAVGLAGLRLYSNEHWLTDVVAAAGIGILGARVGHWMLPVYRRWFHWTGNTTVAAIPTYDPITRSPGLALAMRF